MLNTHGYVLLGPYRWTVFSIPTNNDFRRQKSPRIVTTMNHCRSTPLRGIATTHNPHTTQKITDRKQVVCRVVGHNYHAACLLPHLSLNREVDSLLRNRSAYICINHPRLSANYQQLSTGGLQNTQKLEPQGALIAHLSTMSTSVIS